MATAGGVALIVPKRWACVRVPLSARGDNFEAMAVVLLPPDSNSQPFKLLCIYDHPGDYFPPTIISDFKNKTFNGKAIGGLIVGDMNCPHAAFGSQTTNEFGLCLLQTLNQEDLIYYNPGSPTYYSNAAGSSNILQNIA